MTQRFIGFALAGALTAGMAFAQTPAGTAQAAPAGNATARAKTRRGAARHRMVKALALTDTQKQQARAIFQAAKTANQPVRAQLQQNRQAMTAAVKANDIAQIRQLAQTQGNLAGQLAASRAESMAKFYAILTPDQQAKAGQMQQKLKQFVARKRSNG